MNTSSNPYRQAANELSGLGRFGDTTMVHMNPIEVAMMDHYVPGGLTRNPHTGKPEAFLPFLIPVLLGAALSGGTAAAQGADWKKALKSAAIGGATSLATAGLGSMFSPASAVGTSGIGDAVQKSIIETVKNPVQTGIESAFPIPNIDVLAGLDPVGLGTSATGATGGGGGGAFAGTVPEVGGAFSGPAPEVVGGFSSNSVSPVADFGGVTNPGGQGIHQNFEGSFSGQTQAPTQPSFLENLNEGIGSAFDQAKEYGTQFKDSVGDYLTEKAPVSKEGMSDYVRLREVQDYFGNPVNPLAAVAASEMLTPQEKEKYESIIWPDTSWGNYGAGGGSGTSWSNW